MTVTMPYLTAKEYANLIDLAMPGASARIVALGLNMHANSHYNYLARGVTTQDSYDALIVALADYRDSLLKRAELLTTELGRLTP